MRISLKHVKICLAGLDIIKGISLEMRTGENWAFIGETASGKSTLAKAIANKVFFQGKIEITEMASLNAPIRIELIEQQHRFKNKLNTSQFYYQQRFNSADSEQTIKVGEALQEISKDPAELKYWTTLFSIDHLIDKSIIQLSNGENKRLQLTKAILKKPDLLILDNPFVGLDGTGRKDLADTLDKMANKGIKLIIIAQEQDLPSCISQVAVLKNGELIEIRIPAREKLPTLSSKEILINDERFDKFKPEKLITFEMAIKMVNVNVVYNQQAILKNINWQVNKGERWGLSGPNGSGKSTLLSLINADNPQAYANDIWIFDRKRGTGESIWDIKKNIGFISPELHLYFEKGITCTDTIASGLFDTIGLFRKPNADQREWIAELIRLFGLEDIEHAPLERVSHGKQRLVLLARALIKKPSLLLLDEPCQGLDQVQVEYFKNLIDSICMRNDITLIYVSHYDSDWPSCIDKIIKLDHGMLA